MQVLSTRTETDQSYSVMDGLNELVPSTGSCSMGSSVLCLLHLVGAKVFVVINSICARVADKCLHMHCSDSSPLSVHSLSWLVMVALAKQHL